MELNLPSICVRGCLTVANVKTVACFVLAKLFHHLSLWWLLNNASANMISLIYTFLNAKTILIFSISIWLNGSLTTNCNECILCCNGNIYINTVSCTSLVLITFFGSHIDSVSPHVNSSCFNFKITHIIRRWHLLVTFAALLS
jgi:hypothetical protein